MNSNHMYPERCGGVGCQIFLLLARSWVCLSVYTLCYFALWYIVCLDCAAMNQEMKIFDQEYPSYICEITYFFIFFRILGLVAANWFFRSWPVLDLNVGFLWYMIVSELGSGPTTFIPDVYSDDFDGPGWSVYLFIGSISACHTHRVLVCFKAILSEGILAL